MLALILAVPALLAFQPRVANARLETRAAGGLETELRRIAAASASPAWTGYSIASVERSGECCSGPNGACRCSLEKGTQAQAAEPAPVRLEPSREIMVLLRFEQGRLDKIRTFDIDCQIDAGGLPFYWLTGVGPQESLAWLQGLTGDTRFAEAATGAIAQHADRGADTILNRLAAAGQPDRLRRSAIFWLGASRGASGFDALRRIRAQDPDPRIRERAVFALSVSKQPGAIDAILAAARNDTSPRVRGQSLFWLAQKAARQAAPAIQNAIESDPDTEVKKKAVFALSRMDDGVPRLIAVARSHANPEVRKQAMFWLGQSKDPRALSFFEEILKRP